MGLRLRLLALIFIVFSIFLSFPPLDANSKNCVTVFSDNIKVRILKLGMYMDNDLLYSLVLFLSFCPFFCLFRVNLCHRFLKNKKENPQKLTQLSSRSHPRHLQDNYASYSVQTWHTYGD